MTEFLDLFPTKLVRRHLNNFEEPTRDLIKLIREMEKANKSLTTDYRENNPLEYDRAGPNWLRGEINQTVIEYLQSIGINYAVNWQIHAWANINRLGDYHDPHNHPHAYLSGTYYLKMPSTTQKPTRQRSDVRPGCITFYDPRTGFNMSSIRNDPYVDPEFTVLPEPGLLMMWPGSLMHFVHPNLADETRISLSFNIVLKWSDDYLPRQ
tara:strand:- start:6975 stop:7601 length:627 start_codon:yes stop_codon:yes gene_type:complete